MAREIYTAILKKIIGNNAYFVLYNEQNNPIRTISMRIPTLKRFYNNPKEDDVVRLALDRKERVVKLRKLELGHVQRKEAGREERTLEGAEKK